MPALPGQAGSPRAAAPYAASFGAGDLRRLRRAVAEWAVQAGLRGRRAGDFLIAVNQVASTAVWRGSPAARLKLQVAGGGRAGRGPRRRAPAARATRSARRARDGPAGGAPGL